MTQLMTFVNAMPGNISQGLIWGILAIGVFITYKILDFADLTVDGSMATGGAVCVMLITNGCPVWLAMRFYSRLSGGYDNRSAEYASRYPGDTGEHTDADGAVLNKS